MPQPVKVLGGHSTNPVIHLAVANGFPPETYIPMLRPFMDDYAVVSLPPRALWGDQDPPPHYGNWDQLGDDLLTGLRQNQLQNVIAIGHSFGGIATILAAIQEPDRFRAIALLDPTILPPPGLRLLKEAREQNLVQDIPLVAGALRRHRDFDSVDAAFDYFRQKTFFRNWSDEVVRLYAKSGTRPVGDGVTLAWSPDWEAYYFSTVHTTIWEDLTYLSSNIPLLVIRGGDSDTLFPDAFKDVQSILPHGTFHEMAGQGHLFPQTSPTETSNMIRAWLVETL